MIFSLFISILLVYKAGKSLINIAINVSTMTIVQHAYRLMPYDAKRNNFGDIA